MGTLVEKRYISKALKTDRIRLAHAGACLCAVVFAAGSLEVWESLGTHGAPKLRNSP